MGLCSCSGGSNYPEDPTKYFEVATVAEVEAVADLNDYGILMPTGLAAHSGRLYLQMPGEEIIKEVDIANSVVTTRLLTGNGPGEFSAPSYLTTSGNKSTLIDVNRMIFAEIDMSQSGNNFIFTELSKVQGPCMSVIATADYLILTGILEQGRYMYYDRNNGDIIFFGEYRLPKKFGDLRNFERSQVYINTKLALKPDQRRFAAINFNSGVIDINEVRNDSIIHVKGLDFHYPGVAVRNGRFGQGMDEKNGFIDIAASDDRIYVIYSGKSYREYGPDFAFCDWLMVFDWDGNPISCYRLPVPFNVICYDPIRNELYGVSSDETTMLYKVDLID